MLNAFGPCVAALTFVHVFSGCGTLSNCREKGKMSAWLTMEGFPDVKDVFFFAEV